MFLIISAYVWDSLCVKIKHPNHTNYFSRIYNKKGALNENLCFVSKYLNPINKNLEYFEAKNSRGDLRFIRSQKTNHSRRNDVQLYENSIRQLKKLKGNYMCNFCLLKIILLEIKMVLVYLCKCIWLMDVKMF